MSGRGDKASERGRGRGRGNIRGQHGGSSNDGAGGGPSRDGYRGSSGHRSSGPHFPRGGRGGRGGQHPMNLPIRSGPPHMDNRPVPPRIYLAGSPLAPPDGELENLEDELVKSTSGKMIDGFPGRWSYGTAGKSIKLRTNYFEMAVYQEGTRIRNFHKYSMEWNPALSGPKRRQAVTQILKEPFLVDIPYATDFGDILVTTAPLDLGASNQIVKRITIEAPGTVQSTATESKVPDFVAEAQRRNTVECTISSQGTFSVGDLVSSLKAKTIGPAFAGSDEVVQMLNIVISKPPNENLGFAKVGGNKFFPIYGNTAQHEQELGGGLLALRGYYCSARPAIGRMLLNVNVTCGAFYESKDLIKHLEAFGHNMSECEAFLQRLKVMVEYTKTGQREPFMVRQKTIQGFAKRPRFGNANTVMFSYKNPSNAASQPRNITVSRYFQEHHGIRLQRPDLPVLNVGTIANPSYIPVEMCKVLPGQPYKKRLSGEQTTAMLQFACKRPHQNAEAIANMGLRVFGLQDPNNGAIQETTTEPFGFRVQTEMKTVHGRILHGPKLQYHNRTEEARKAAWNLTNKRFIQGRGFERWKAMIINTSSNHGNALRGNPENLFHSLTLTLQSYGVAMGERRPTETITLAPLTREQRENNNERLAAAFARAKENDNVKLLFIVLKEHDTWLYARIKYYGDIVYGIQTICSVGHKLQNERGQQMYMANLALKFNVKGGGISHVVEHTMVKPVDGNTMVMGIDVTHPSPGSMNGAPSIACVVGSVDKYLFQWPGSIRTQTGRMEMVEALADMVKERLQLWRKRHDRLPDKIIVYRDGVSEGQFRIVLDQEYPSFQQAYEQLYGDENNWPKTTIVIVGKRHHTRFYPTDQNHWDEKNGNPLPGTIVDRGIAGRSIHEFWLQAHSGLMGTARPAHYSVIKDEIGFTADELQQFTHRLCYYFVRCTRAVSICPPAYYADLLAERGRCYLFSVLQENNASDGASIASSSTSLDWTGGVHPDLAESTWYI